MKGNFDRCFDLVLKHEGGWVDHPADPGGATMKGVTIGTFAQFKGRKVTKDELRNISDADLRAIYKRGYWDKVRGDELPAGLDHVAFDAAVNSGPSRGIRLLQQALGVTADGKIGPETLARAQSVNARSAIEAALMARLSFMRSLKHWPTFGKGWQARVNRVRDEALGMVGKAPAKPAPLSPKPVDDSPKPDPAAKPRGLLAGLMALLRSMGWVK